MEEAIIILSRSFTLMLGSIDVNDAWLDFDDQKCICDCHDEIISIGNPESKCVVVL